MSMYPQPYHTPQMPQYYGAPVDALRPARRASLLMFILRPIMLLLATCLFSMPALMNSMPGPEVQQLRSKLAAQSPMPIDTMFHFFGVLCAVPGLSLLVLAFFVRGGGKVSTILACVVVGLVMLVMGFNTIAAAAQASDPNGASAVCFGLVASAVVVLQFVWLIQAAMASGKVQNAQQQYAAQYWQYQQTMQAYANAGYGYPQQPPAPPAPTTPVPPPISPSPQTPSDQPPT